MKPVLDRDLWAGAALDSLRERAPAHREPRRQVELSGYLIRSDKRIVDVKITNVTYDGCGVQTLTPLVAGEHLKLTILGRGAVSAVVRWYASRRAGLLFLPDEAPRANRARQAERIPVDAEVSLRRSGKPSYRVRAFDISRFGCKCEFVERPTISERLFVKIGAMGSVEAVVSWVEQSCLGLMFETPLHPAVFDLLLPQLRPSASIT